jgi:hypothetical protein
MTLRIMSMKRLRLFPAVFALAGCGDWSRPSAPPAPCQGEIDVVVTQTPVRFHWLPACGISRLTVTTVEASPLDEHVVWGWTVPEQRPVGPTILYGQTPDEASVWTSPEALEVGREYRVTVMQTVGEDVRVASGTRTFRWFLPD